MEELEERGCRGASAGEPEEPEWVQGAAGAGTGAGEPVQESWCRRASAAAGFVGGCRARAIAGEPEESEWVQGSSSMLERVQESP